MKKLMSRLDRGEILVADGAMGTMLMELGLELGQPPESFNLTHIEALQEIARAYLDAGADVIQTNTFGASGLKLASFSLQNEVREINRKAVVAVKKTVEDKAYVSGSVGPTGRFLKPYGDVELSEMSESFQEQMSALADAGVDTICVETMIDIEEATCAIKAAKSVAHSIPVMATMTFDATPKGFFTVMGVTVEQAARRLEAAGADIIGSNCGNGIEKMVSIAQEFKRSTKLPVMIQANAGKPELKGDEVIYPETPEFMAEKAEQLIALGVSIIGGCCGTTPAHIRALRKRVDACKRMEV